MKKRPLDVRITLRIDKADRDKAQKLAAADSRRLSDWLRLVIHRAVEK